MPASLEAPARPGALPNGGDSGHQLRSAGLEVTYSVGGVQFRSPSWLGAFLCAAQRIALTCPDNGATAAIEAVSS
jgi:hypothetical protein